MVINSNTIEFNNPSPNLSSIHWMVINSDTIEFNNLAPNFSYGLSYKAGDSTLMVGCGLDILHSYKLFVNCINYDG